MKSKTILAAAIMAIFSTPALADIKPYVGVDLQRSKVSYPDNGDLIAQNYLDGLNVYAGIRPWHNFGIEAGFFQTEHASKNDVLGLGINTSVRINGLTLDGMGYLPVSKDGKFELIGSAGIVNSKVDLALNGAGGALDSSERETSWRLGGGAQYHLTEKVAVHALVHYQKADFDDDLNNIITASVGVNLSF